MEPNHERLVQHSNGTEREKKFNFGPFKRSKVTRIVYVLYIIIIIFLCIILLTPKIVGFFQRIFCREFSYYFCELMVGYDAVYRLGFALAIWFMILAFATLRIASSTQERANIQNRYWVVKTIGLILGGLLFLLIPHNEYNGEIWLFFGLNAAFCFIILQYTFILDATNSFCILFRTITENRHGQFSSLTVNLLRAAMVFTTVFLYSVSFLTSGGFYFMHASYNECFDNFVFLTFHLLMCFASSVICLLPIVRETSPQAGLFQCGVTSLYCTYIIWLAFSGEPQPKCNPTDLHRFPGSPLANIQVWVTLFITFSTLIFVCIRDLVSPQFGKVEKADCSTSGSKVTENLKQAYSSFEDRGITSKDSNPKGNNRKGMQQRNETKISGDCKNFDEFHRPSNGPGGKRFIDSNRPNTDSLQENSSGKREPSSNTVKKTATEGETTSLAWDNTLFLSSISNRDEVESLQQSKLLPKDSSKDSPFTALKDETSPVMREDTVNSTENHLSNSDGNIIKSTSEFPASISDFTTKNTREGAVDPKEKRLTNPSLKNSNSPQSPFVAGKCFTTNNTLLIWDDEVDGVEYSYPFFHLTFSLATLYLIMSITNWYRLDEGEHLTVRLVQSWSAVWLRISASIFCSFILIWSMIIPLVFPNSYKDLLFFQYLTSLRKY